MMQTFKLLKLKKSLHFQICHIKKFVNYSNCNILICCPNSQKITISKQFRNIMVTKLHQDILFKKGIKGKITLKKIVNGPYIAKPKNFTTIF